MSEESQQRDGENDTQRRPVRARQSAVPRTAGERSYKAFYPDEHPEIPRIRRASLKQARAETLTATDQDLGDTEAGLRRSADIPSLPTKKQQHTEMLPFTGLEKKLDPRLQNRQNRPRTETRDKSTMLPFTGLEDDMSDTARHERVGVADRQDFRNTSKRLAMPRSARRVRQSISTPFWRRRRNWILLALLAILLLVLTPIINGIVHNTTSPQSSRPSSTTSSVSISQLQNVPSNSHEMVIVPPKTDHPAPPVFAESAYLLDANSEQTLYAQNAFTHLPMLSTTKLMTATIAVETGNLDQQITITPAMEQDINQLSSDSALFGVKLGETYTLRDLLYGLLFVSGNDAALVIADALAGNVPNFVAEMNQKAQQLGLNDTHYVNPHGLLNPGQYSCARDLAVLGQYSLSIPALQQISSTRTYNIAASGNHGARTLQNENQFLWWFPGANGGKTGFDGVSDFVQVMSVTRNNHHLIGVVIHTTNWWTDMRDLMDYGFNDYTWISPHNVDASGQYIPYDNLWNYFASDTPDVSISLAPDQRYYVSSGYTVSGAILTYFDKNGGLKTFGFPLKMPTPSNGTSMTQQFQHGSILCNLTNNQCSTV
ncbi:MAG TPA: D-alanyl-D-alanine carboxypeptidase family protein [Ktedonobacteraceae bacterium]